MVIRQVSISDQMDLPESNDIFCAILGATLWATHGNTPEALERLTGLAKFKIYIYPQRDLILGSRGPVSGATAMRCICLSTGPAPPCWNSCPRRLRRNRFLLNGATVGSGVRSSVLHAEGTVTVKHAAGEPGTQRGIGVLRPAGAHITTMTVNGAAVKSAQAAGYVSAQVRMICSCNSASGVANLATARVLRAKHGMQSSASFMCGL